MALLPVFDKYFTKEDSDYYYQLFCSVGLTPLVDTPKESFDAIFGNSQVDLQYVLRLPATDFPKAMALLEQEIRKKDLPEDYYLHQLDNSELYQILINTKDWSRQDVIAAKILLEKRRVVIDEDKINVSKEEQKVKEKQEQKISIPVLIILYVIAPLGAFLPIIAGIIIYTLKDTDLDGKKDYVFDNNYRTHGLVITAIGLASTAAWYFWLFY
jgi:hypothetical protein